MNIIYVLIFVLFDILIFPNRDKLGFLFYYVMYQGRKLYPIYRAIQFILYLFGCYLLYSNWIQIAGFTLAFVLLTTDLLYYLIKDRLIGLKEMQGKWTYWLNNFWQSGSILFKKGFDLKWFYISSLTGLAILIISNFI